VKVPVALNRLEMSGELAPFIRALARVDTSYSERVAY
jgi:hypothetical protein